MADLTIAQALDARVARALSGEPDVSAQASRALIGTAIDKDREVLEEDVDARNVETARAIDAAWKAGNTAEAVILQKNLKRSEQRSEQRAARHASLRRF
jgi:hypothetical protein